MIDAQAPEADPWPKGFSRQFRSARRRAGILVGALVILAGLSALTILHFFTGFSLIAKARNGILTFAEAQDFDSAGVALATWYVIFVLVATVALLAWLSRSIDNAPSLGAGTPVQTPRWSIGWWFIPVANLFKPHEAVQDLNGRMALPGERPGGRLVTAWWLVWVGGNYIAAWLVRLPNPDSLDGLSDLFGLASAAEAISIAGATLAIMVVRRIQRRANERASVFAVPATPGESPSDGMHR